METVPRHEIERANPPRVCSHRRQLRMEPLWSPAVATGGNRWRMHGREHGGIERRPLPWVATACRRPHMVRRGSPVRVRQRATAAERWPRDGRPPNPTAWPVITARNRAIDPAAPRPRARREGAPARRARSRGGRAEDTTLPDERLGLIFGCHPALGLEAQVALTLPALGGLRTGEIAARSWSRADPEAPGSRSSRCEIQDGLAMLEVCWDGHVVVHHQPDAIDSPEARCPTHPQVSDLTASVPFRWLTA
jgi:hypothetical protein